MTQPLTFLFLRDLDKLIEELKLYPSEDSLWLISGDIKNSAGTLALHLAGNIRHYIGAELGKNGYVRNRDLEFSARNVPREEIIAEAEKAKADVKQVIPSLTEAQLKGAFPGKIPIEATTEGFLLHLYNHLGYHLGQINYHRRLLAV